MFGNYLGINKNKKVSVVDPKAKKCKYVVFDLILVSDCYFF